MTPDVGLVGVDGQACAHAHAALGPRGRGGQEGDGGEKEDAACAREGHHPDRISEAAPGSDAEHNRCG
jgi:hypothetical protein